jgi:hypothetical protein
MPVLVGPRNPLAVRPDLGVRRRRAIFTARAKIVKARSDADYEGFLIGSKGVTGAPGTPFARIAKIVPEGARPEGEAVFVNGVANTVSDQSAQMQCLADKMNMSFVGVHNATKGLVADVGEAVAQKMGLRHADKSAGRLQRLILLRISAKEPLTLVAHSQGALVISEALRRVQRSLRARGLGPADVEKELGAIKVETYASAAATFPDGPQYVHYINDADFVPRWFGPGDPEGTEHAAPAWGRWLDSALGAIGIRTRFGSQLASKIRSVFSTPHHPGRGAAVVHFRDDGAVAVPGQPLAAHLLATYLQHRLPFEEALKKYGQFSNK